MSANRIDATLTDAQRDRANAALASLAEALPFLNDLSAKDRAESPKFGDKNRAFVVNALASPERTPTCCRAVSISRNSAPTCKSSRASTRYSPPSRPCTARSPIPTSPPAAKPKPPPCWSISTPNSTMSTPAPWRTAWTTLAAASPASPTRPLPRLEGNADARDGWFHPGHETTNVRHGLIHPEHGTTDF